MAGYTDGCGAGLGDGEEAGQVVKPGPPVERTLVGSVAELCKDTPPPRDAPERVDWLSFLRCDLENAPGLPARLGPEPPLVLALGLARGYQIWALLANGDCEELISDRQGPVKTLKFLPTPSQSGSKERWCEQRPLIGVVDSISAVSGRLHSTLSLVSLATAQPVHSLKFEEPIASFQASTRYIVAVFPGRFCVFDACSFNELFWINGYKPDDGSGTPVELATSWIAYADTKLCGSVQSWGGVHSGDSLPAYASHVISAAKNLRQTVSSISESLGGRASAAPEPAVLTLINASKWPKGQSDVSSLSSRKGVDSGAVICHWAALKDESAVAIRLDNARRLLAVAGASGQALNVFAILPHPAGSSLAAARHLYSLFRGTTPAAILNIAFAPDSRWLGISTNHGTTHVFPITPYGGAITHRTHGGAFVNKDSRFHRSAGVDRMMGEVSLAHSPATRASSSSPKGSPLSRDTHPLMKGGAGEFWKVSGNPRLPPFSAPTLVQAAGKVYQQLVPGVVGAWAGDLGEGFKTARQRRAIAAQDSAPLAAAGSLAFAGPRSASDSANASLFLLSENGELWEYGLEVAAAAPVTTKGSKDSADAPINLQLAPAALWTLQRTKSSPDLRPPLGKAHLLRQAARSLTPKSPPMHPPSPRIQHPAPNPPTHWIAQVEMVTYQGPSRRLWMGPQFTFRTYVETPVSGSQSSLAPDPDSPQAPVRTGSGKKGRRKKREPATAPILPKQPPPPSNPMTIAGAEGATSRLVPVVLDSPGAGKIGEVGIGAELTLEVCGSWSSTGDHILAAEGGDARRLRESIADAMRSAGGSGRSHRDSGDSDMEDARDSFSDTDSPHMLHSFDP